MIEECSLKEVHLFLRSINLVILYFILNFQEQRYFTEIAEYILMYLKADFHVEELATTRLNNKCPFLNKLDSPINSLSCEETQLISNANYAFEFLNKPLILE